MAGTLLELSEGHELLTEQVQVHVAPAQTCHISNSPCLCGTDFSAIGHSGTKGLNDETYTVFFEIQMGRKTLPLGSRHEFRKIHLLKFSD